MSILTKDDLSPKFSNVTQYLIRGDQRYDELCENFRVLDANRRPATTAGVSAKVKRYLSLFVSKQYSRDRIGTNIQQSIDGQTVDQWQAIFNTYDAEENQRLNELTYWDVLTDEARGETNNTSSYSMEFRRS